ncbi:MAG: phosphoribosylaminoimidazolesuccinocarboxamide synthase [Pyrinomonadaceae bacterium]|nr:phosphoribosylaminoimidazolesuccinocarboxamide synthase [Pyrinomonadaceae bacterium]
MSNAVPVVETSLHNLQLVQRGKVRDVYKIDEDHLLIVATDRLSAFDCVLPTAIERKGEVLTALSEFWFKRLRHIVPHHLISTKLEEMPNVIRHEVTNLAGRSMYVRRTHVFPVECVVRGYLAGSGWKDYQRTGGVCGHRLQEGLREADELPEPIFTPATKAATGHDENISEAEMTHFVGAEVTRFLRDAALQLYKEAAGYARRRGIIIADTKFEFGQDRDGHILLIDEVLTPDSSRFWPADQYQPGRAQRSFDKQFVRDYLETLQWDKQPPAPPLPPAVAATTTTRYLEAYRMLTGSEL